MSTWGQREAVREYMLHYSKNDAVTSECLHLWCRDEQIRAVDAVTESIDRASNTEWVSMYQHAVY